MTEVILTKGTAEFWAENIREGNRELVEKQGFSKAYIKTMPKVLENALKRFGLDTSVL